LGEAWKFDVYLKKTESLDARSCSVEKSHVLKRTEGNGDPNFDVNCNGLSVTVLKKAVFDFLNANCYSERYLE
jgi:hypothetical protein